MNQLQFTPEENGEARPAIPGLCPTCGAPFNPYETASKNPLFSAVAVEAPGERLPLQELAHAIELKLERPFGTKRAGKLARSLGLKVTVARFGGPTSFRTISCLFGWRLR